MTDESLTDSEKLFQALPWKEVDVPAVNYMAVSELLAAQGVIPQDRVKDTQIMPNYTNRKSEDYSTAPYLLLIDASGTSARYVDLARQESEKGAFYTPVGVVGGSTKITPVQLYEMHMSKSDTLHIFTSEE